MRLLYIYYEPHQSGQTTHVLSLTHGLCKRNHDITVVLPSQLHSCIPMFEQAGAGVITIPMHKIRWDPQAVIVLARLIRKIDFDIVHIHSQEAGLIARGLARLLGAHKIIYTPQTIDIRQKQWQWLYSLTERFLALLTDKIISVNQIDQDRLIHWGIASKKLITIPNGIDFQIVDQLIDPVNARLRLGLKGDQPVVMQVGRLSAQKAPLDFIEGAALVLHQAPGTQFVLIGEGPLAQAVGTRVKELGLEENVHLMGWIGEAYKFMMPASVVTLTSRWEGTPFSLLEAMACSKPVVATAVNGCSEIVMDGESGFLVPPGDIETWSQRVVDLVKDPEQAAKMGLKGYNHVRNKYSIDMVISQIEKLYLQVIG